MYTAEMKNPVRDSLASKKAKVALVLEQLALTSCKHVKIGNALDRGISGASDSLLLIRGLTCNLYSQQKSELYLMIFTSGPWAKT